MAVFALALAFSLRCSLAVRLGHNMENRASTFHYAALSSFANGDCDWPAIGKELRLNSAKEELKQDYAKHLKIAPWSIPRNGRRVVAIGDVHGDLTAFLAALVAADLIDTKEDFAGAEAKGEVVWKGGTTIAVQVGDFCDRTRDHHAGKTIQDEVRHISNLHAQSIVPTRYSVV